MPNWFLDTDSPPDGKYDTEVKRMGNSICTVSGGASTEHQKIHSTDPDALDRQLESVARSLAATNNWVIGSGGEGAALGGTSGEHDPMGDKFQYTEGEFDPTSEQFKTSVLETGGFEELAGGLGLEESDFDEFYGKPLDFWEEEYSTEIDPETGLPKGTLAQQRGLDLQEYGLQRSELGLEREEYGFQREEIGLGREQLGLTGETLAENLRAATTSYDIGRRRTGMLAGKSLFDIKEQGDVAAARSGLATSGTIAATTGRAQKGIFQDYALQQKELASQMTGAKSAFDIGTKGIDIAQRGFDISESRIGAGERGLDISESRIGLGEQGVGITATQADIDWKRKQADFWKTTEDEFWEDAGFVEGF